MGGSLECKPIWKLLGYGAAVGPSDEQSLQQQTSELVSYPREEMGVDCKGWIDLDQRAERAKISKDLMALANHGGGFLVFGIDESHEGQFTHSGTCPYDLKYYSQDWFNDIVKAYASPAFECRALRVPCPSDCGGDHVVVKVPGEHRVPIRCRRGGPDNGEPQKGVVYIRRPKPESGPVEEPHEWDDLFERCIRVRRDELVEGFMAVVGAIGVEGLSEVLSKKGDGAGSSEPKEAVVSFRLSSSDRFDEIQKEHGVQDLYAHGIWSVSYAVTPSPGTMPLPRLLEILTEVAGSETGWPPWWVPTREGIRPYPYEDMIECWLAEPDAPTSDPENWLRAALGPKDSAHADFWRASPAGQLFLARGYQEDGRQGSEPGQHLDFTTVPIWRLGECLLHAQRFALECGGSDATVAFSIRWEGLANRTLVSLTDREINPRRCNQDTVESYAEFSAAGLRGRLPEVLQELARPLYTAFEFFDPPLSLFEEEIARMLKT
jgi:hypothetical protein